jgi:probable HAF family extracellular repeat protein
MRFNELSRSDRTRSGASRFAVLAAVAAAGCGGREEKPPPPPPTAAFDAATLALQDLGPGRCIGITDDGATILGLEVGHDVAFSMSRVGVKTPLTAAGAPLELLAVSGRGDFGGISNNTGKPGILSGGVWSELPLLVPRTFVKVTSLTDHGFAAGVARANPLTTTMLDKGGVAQDVVQPPLYHGVAFDGGQIIDIRPGDRHSDARSVNAAGVVVGSYETAAGETHAYRYEIASRAFTDLGTLGGALSVANKIGPDGSIVGVSKRADGAARAFVVPPGGAMKDLGTLGGTSEAKGVGRLADGRVVVVGSSAVGGGAPGELPRVRPFVFDRGALVGILPPASADAYVDAAAIAVSRSGIVVGWGRSTADHQPHCLVWSNTAAKEASK